MRRGTCAFPPAYSILMLPGPFIVPGERIATGPTPAKPRDKRKNLGTIAVPRFFIWQRVKDSNPHIQSQSLLCYPYTNPLDPFAVVHRSEQILLYTKEDFCQQVFQKNFIIF